ncbi:MAG TPA: hypothetical protein VGX50_17220 [Longimicrobium sp.]|jgi:hypothetical protein|nr:hypothetical protein [Longimicrobium sp.]
MRLFRPRWLLVVLIATAGCLWPTDEDIENAQEQELRSVAGNWVGTSPTLTLNFQLTEGTGNTISGSGMMKEAAAASSVPITILGTFERPYLSLNFSGMNFEGRAVQGAFSGSYTTTGGISGPLHLTGTGYSKDITILLQEQ